MISREQFKELKKLPFYKGEVVSGSMDPVIKVGDEITIDIGFKDLKRFDIIVFYMDGKLICHYLWNRNTVIRPLLLQTRSMLGHKDIPIREEDYLGKVISHKLSFWQKLKCLL